MCGCLSPQSGLGWGNGCWGLWSRKVDWGIAKRGLWDKVGGGRL